MFGCALALDHFGRNAAGRNGQNRRPPGGADVRPGDETDGDRQTHGGDAGTSTRRMSRFRANDACVPGPWAVFSPRFRPKGAFWIRRSVLYACLASKQSRKRCGVVQGGGQKRVLFRGFSMKEAGSCWIHQCLPDQCIYLLTSFYRGWLLGGQCRHLEAEMESSRSGSCQPLPRELQDFEC